MHILNSIFGVTGDGEMTEFLNAQFFDYLCVGLSVVFFWSTFIVLAGLIKPAKIHPKAVLHHRFAVLICARNEERVIRLPVMSLLRSKYPAENFKVIVLADNCVDETVRRAKEAGAEVWEKTFPSSGKGDVLSWGVEKVIADGSFDAIAVFDADNSVSDTWLLEVNDALQDGETIVTGRRQSSNARDSLISGWYTVYWAMMNELSNRVRTNLGLSGKLTGTGFAFTLSALGEEGWKTRTMVEDVEFTVQANIRGRRVAYVPAAEFADEQPVSIIYMWRQLRRWSTGGWQVVRSYIGLWIRTLFLRPSLRLFDSFFAILTGMSVAFILLSDVVSIVVRMLSHDFSRSALSMSLGVVFFVCFMGWITGWAAVALSSQKRRPSIGAIVTFPIFSIILAASLLYVLVFPTKRWKPIPHGKKSENE